MHGFAGGESGGSRSLPVARMIPGEGAVRFDQFRAGLVAGPKYGALGVIEAKLGFGNRGLALLFRDRQGRGDRLDPLIAGKRARRFDVVARVADDRSHGAALDIVGFKQRCRRLTLRHQSQFPAEIERILDAGIHAVAFHRAAGMRGIAGKKHGP